MPLTQLKATRILGRYADQISQLLGTPVPSDLRVRVMPSAQYEARYPGTGAYSLAGNVIAMPDTAGDPRRLIAYEAAHQMAAGAGVYTQMGEHGLTGTKAGKASEALSGVVLQRLGLQPAGWAPNARQARFASLTPPQLRAVGQDLEAGTYTSIRDSIGGTVAAPNRPASGRNPGHTRNAGTNQRSGNNGALPTTQPAATAVLPPGQSAAFTQQLAALQSQYSQQLAAIKMQGGDIRAQRVSAFADIKANQIAGAVGAESSALQRGIVGSSADLGNRAGVVATAAGQRVDARSAAGSALAQLRVSQMQAGTDYSMGIAGVLADKAAAQQELANQRYQNGLIGQAISSYQDLYQAALKRLLARGKNPPGVDPRAGTVAGLLRPYGDPFGGKVEPQGQYYPQPVLPGVWATGGGLG